MLGDPSAILNYRILSLMKWVSDTRGRVGNFRLVGSWVPHECAAPVLHCRPSMGALTSETRSERSLFPTFARVLAWFSSTLPQRNKNMRSTYIVLSVFDETNRWTCWP